MGNGGVCVWTNSTFANFKINKQTKRKRNSRGQLQGRLMHHSNLLDRNGVSEPQLSFSTISVVFERFEICSLRLLILISILPNY